MEKETQLRGNPAIDPYILSHAQVLAVVKNLIGIRDDRVRRRIIDLIQSVHDSQKAA